MNQIETAAVRTEGVWKIFQQEAEEVTAVRDVSLTIDRGEFTKARAAYSDKREVIQAFRKSVG